MIKLKRNLVTVLKYFHERMFQLIMQLLVFQKMEYEEFGLDLKARQTQISNRVSYSFKCRVIHFWNDKGGKKVTYYLLIPSNQWLMLFWTRYFYFYNIMSSTLKKLGEIL